MPDYEDFIYVGRTIAITSFEDEPELLAHELDELANQLRAGAGLRGCRLISGGTHGSTFRARYCDLTVDVDVGAELAALLFRFAAYHVKRAGVPHGSGSIVMTDPWRWNDMKLSNAQIRAVLGLVESTPWADVEGSIEAVDHALRIALELTRDEFAFWHTQLEPEGENEFDHVLIRDAPPHIKRALIARLLRTIAVAYGVGTEFGALELGQPCDGRHHIRATVQHLLDAASGARCPQVGLATTDHASDEEGGTDER